MIEYGFIAGWVGPNEMLLTSDETPLPSGRITLEQFSWITSIMAFGGLIGNIVFGFIMKKFGRIKPLIFTSILLIVSYIQFGS